ncbi:uncharacterized protein LOC133314048 [Gastrolobium bilobum]|uniref:uncharacterized protein LOC133314048 n=1 Tax=Gastrolobium bilobum TaxID=150636 RepID=UPI002AAFDB63|nr:uncharacterized protein LOC133314048 [Gastrolobium bilobum]
MKRPYRPVAPKLLPEISRRCNIILKRDLAPSNLKAVVDASVRFFPSEFENDVDRTHAVDPAKSAFQVSPAMQEEVQKLDIDTVEESISTGDNQFSHESMGTRKGNKLASHVATESISVDSLSFAGLVSAEDQQQPKPSVPNQNKHSQVSKQDSDFEFATIKADINSGAIPIKITPADVLISNGQIKPHAIAFQPINRRPLITNPTVSLRSLLVIDHHVSSKMSSEQTSGARKYHEQLVKGRNHKNKERTWFGQKVLRSFLSPCRECKAIQPAAVKGQTVAGEKFKIP